MITPQEIAWLAGIIEGEGCFTVPVEERNLAVTVVMTDLDTVSRVAMFMGTKLRGPRKHETNRRPQFYTTATGTRAAGVMMTIYTFMSERRKDRIKEALAVWKARPRRLTWTDYATCNKYDVSQTLAAAERAAVLDTTRTRGV